MKKKIVYALLLLAISCLASSCNNSKICKCDVYEVSGSYEESFIADPMNYEYGVKTCSGLEAGLNQESASYDGRYYYSCSKL